jgi:hypothetical protein
LKETKTTANWVIGMTRSFYKVKDVKIQGFSEIF